MWQVTILKVISSFFNTFSTLPSSDSWRLMCAHACSLVRSRPLLSAHVERNLLIQMSTMLSPHTHTLRPVPIFRWSFEHLLPMNSFRCVKQSIYILHNCALTMFYVPKIECINILRNIFFTRYFCLCAWSSRHDYDETRNYRKLFILKYIHRPMSVFNIISRAVLFASDHYLSQSQMCRHLHRESGERTM